MTLPALLLGLVLALVLAPAESLGGQEWEGAEALGWLTEFDDACRRVEPLWPESLCGPVIVVDPGSRRAYLNRPDPHGHFQIQDGGYVGTLPEELPVANTAVEWAGTRWTMVMAPSMGAEQFPRLRLLAHESFHRIQPALGVTQASPMPGHLDDEEPRIWLRMELRALASALTSAPPRQPGSGTGSTTDSGTGSTAPGTGATTGPSTRPSTGSTTGPDGVPPQARGDAGRQAAVDALHFRMQRIRHHPAADSLESLLEANEGLAEYTGFRFAMEATGEGTERVVNAMERFESTPTYVRSLGYGTGPALGLLLDRFADGWRGMWCRKGLGPDSSRAASGAERLPPGSVGPSSPGPSPNQLARDPGNTPPPEPSLFALNPSAARSRDRPPRPAGRGPSWPGRPPRSGP